MEFSLQGSLGAINRTMDRFRHQQRFILTRGAGKDEEGGEEEQEVHLERKYD